MTVKVKLIELLKTPSALISYDLSDWDIVIRQARQANLLAKLYVELGNNDLLDRVPDEPKQHLMSAYSIYERHSLAVRWEVNRILRALQDISVPIVLLKGAAYIMSELPVAQGRIFHDVDILVPRGIINIVEGGLMRFGWAMTHLDKYDQKYYRKWMHELPPLKHVRRKSILDVHHAILPDTARLHPDPRKLLKDSIQVKGEQDLYVLNPVDMVLHSATHLFHDGELEHGLRDLVDLDSLMESFGKEQDFWNNLTERAKELELVRPLYYALRHTTRVLATPVPDKVLQAANIGKPVFLIRVLMDVLLAKALAPDHPSCDGRFTGLARWLLYMRSHYLRMPLYLLVPHLLRKAFRQKKAH